MSIFIMIGLSLGISVVTSCFICFLFLSRKHKVKKVVVSDSPDEEIRTRLKVLNNRLTRCEDFIIRMNAKMQIRESQVNVNMITESNNTPSPKTQGKEKKEKNILKKHQQDERTIKMIQPQDVEYVSLTVTNGSLAVASSSQGSYYRAWNSNGKILFEFFSDKTAKAINNRSVIIDPFCDKALESLSADDASNIETCQFGTLNNDYTLISKTIIKFV